MQSTQAPFKTRVYIQHHYTARSARQARARAEALLVVHRIATEVDAGLRLGLALHDEAAHAEDRNHARHLRKPTAVLSWPSLSVRPGGRECLAKIRQRF